MSIPKVLHYCWFGGAPKPKNIQNCIRSWKKYCPDYEIIEWNEQNFDVSQSLYTRQAYDARRWAFVADYARLKILYEQGGIYMDTDVELLRPLDDLLAYPAFFGFQHNNEVATGLGFGAEAHSPVVKALLDDYDGLPFLLPDERIQITREMPDWQNAIRMASAPLLDNGFINRNYIEKAIDMVETDKRFIMIADGVIIAHAGVDDGVYSMGMSFLRLPEKLSFNGYMDADIIVVLATPDKTRHLPALYQLFDLLEDEGNISAMRRAQDAHEIARLIRKYI